MSTLSAFNTQLDRLIGDLIQYFPENGDFKKFDTICKLLQKTHPRKLMELFKNHITFKYKKHILEKNEDFFLTNTFQEERLNVSNENYANELIKRLKDHWNQIDDKNKETIWKYFQVLVVLSEKEG